MEIIDCLFVRVIILTKDKINDNSTHQYLLYTTADLEGRSCLNTNMLPLASGSKSMQNSHLFLVTEREG